MFSVVLCVYVLNQRPEEHVYPNMPKLTLPRAPSSSSSGRLKLTSATPSLLPVCRGHVTRKGVAIGWP